MFVQVRDFINTLTGREISGLEYKLAQVTAEAKETTEEVLREKGSSPSVITELVDRLADRLVECRRISLMLVDARRRQEVVQKAFAQVKGFINTLTGREVSGLEEKLTQITTKVKETAERMKNAEETFDSRPLMDGLVECLGTTLMVAKARRRLEALVVVEVVLVGLLLWANAKL